MFKKILLAVALALPLSGMAQKFGVVDIESVFQAMPESAAMRAELEETSKNTRTNTRSSPKKSTNSSPTSRPYRTTPTLPTR